MEQKIIFREMLSEIKALADQNGNHLSRAEVDRFFAGAQLAEEQLKLIYEYLISQKIEVEGYQPETHNRFAELMNEGKQEDTGNTEGIPGDSTAENAENSQEDEIRSLELYLEELQNIESVESREEWELFERALAGDALAKSRLVELYLPLVCDLASEYEDPVMPMEDLIQEGNIGLFMAVDNLEKQESLAGYRTMLTNAVNQCLQEMIKEQQDLHDMGEGLAGRVNHLSQAIHNLEEDLEHKVSVEELSAYLEMPLEEIRDILKMAGDELDVDGRTEDE